MVSPIYALKKFVEKNNFQEGAIIKKEELLTFLLIDTKQSLHSIKTAMYFFINLGFIEKKGRNSFILKKKKLNAFLESDNNAC